MKTITSGTYRILNLATNDQYVGSTKNYKLRRGLHLSALRGNRHSNINLQEAWNIYGEEYFKIELVQECEIPFLLIEEQKLLSGSNKNTLYNIRLTAMFLGGAKTKLKPCYILDLKGNIIHKLNSIAEAKEVLGIALDYDRVDTDSKVSKLYRVVTKDFYDLNQQLIKSWSDLNAEMKRELTLTNNKLKKIVIYEGVDYKNFQELANHLNISSERVRQISLNGSKKYKISFKHPELR